LKNIANNYSNNTSGDNSQSPKLQFMHCHDGITIAYTMKHNIFHIVCFISVIIVLKSVVDVLRQRVYGLKIIGKTSS